MDYPLLVLVLFLEQRDTRGSFALHTARATDLTLAEPEEIPPMCKIPSHARLKWSGILSEIEHKTRPSRNLRYKKIHASMKNNNYVGGPKRNRKRSLVGEPVVVHASAAR